VNNISLIKNDTGIGYRATLSNENGAVNLTDTDVLFVFGEFELLPIKEVETGKVLLVFEKVHTAKTGSYRAAFKVRFPDGRLETFPGANETIMQVQIKE